MNLTLRPASAEDAEVIAAWLSHPDINRFLSSNIRGKELSPTVIKVTSKRRDQHWAVACVDEKAVGLVVLDDFDEPDQICNIWYCLGDQSFRGQSIIPRAIKMLLDAPPFQLSVVTAWVGLPNKASIRCLHKAGFSEIGRINNAFHVEGVHPRILFEKSIETQ